MELRLAAILLLCVRNFVFISSNGEHSLVCLRPFFCVRVGGGCVGGGGGADYLHSGWRASPAIAGARIGAGYSAARPPGQSRPLDGLLRGPEPRGLSIS